MRYLGSEVSGCGVDRSNKYAGARVKPAFWFRGRKCADAPVSNGLGAIQAANVTLARMSAESLLSDLRQFMTGPVPYWQTLGLELKEVMPGKTVFEAMVRPWINTESNTPWGRAGIDCLFPHAP